MSEETPKPRRKRKVYRTFPTKVREHAKELLKKNYTIPQVYAETRVPTNVLRRWQTILRQEGAMAATAPLAPPMTEVVTPAQKDMEEKGRVGNFHASVIRVIDANVRKIEEDLSTVTDGASQTNKMLALVFLTQLREFVMNAPPIEKMTDFISMVKALREIDKDNVAEKPGGIDAAVLKMRHPASLPPLPKKPEETLPQPDQDNDDTDTDTDAGE